jgi:hypothetical protein
MQPHGLIWSGPPPSPAFKHRSFTAKAEVAFNSAFSNRHCFPSKEILQATVEL